MVHAQKVVCAGDDAHHPNDPLGIRLDHAQCQRSVLLLSVDHGASIGGRYLERHRQSSVNAQLCESTASLGGAICVISIFLCCQGIKLSIGYSPPPHVAASPGSDAKSASVARFAGTT